MALHVAAAPFFMENFLEIFTLIQKKSCRFLLKTGYFDIKNSDFHKFF